MKQFLPIAVLGAAVFSVFAAPAPQAVPAAEQKAGETITVTAEKPEVKCGEKIIFNLPFSIPTINSPSSLPRNVRRLAWKKLRRNISTTSTLCTTR